MPSSLFQRVLLPVASEDDVRATCSVVFRGYGQQYTLEQATWHVIFPRMWISLGLRNNCLVDPGSVQERSSESANRTVSTGVSASRTTFSATLPSRYRSTRLRPYRSRADVVLVGVTENHQVWGSIGHKSPYSGRYQRRLPA